MIDEKKIFRSLKASVFSSLRDYGAAPKVEAEELKSLKLGLEALLVVAAFDKKIFSCDPEFLKEASTLVESLNLTVGGGDEDVF